MTEEVTVIEIAREALEATGRVMITPHAKGSMKETTTVIGTGGGTEHYWEARQTSIWLDGKFRFGFLYMSSSSMYNGKG